MEKIYIKKTKDKGKTIFANKSFKKNEFIFIISGPVVKKRTIYTIPISKRLSIDPISPGKYLCHCCEPNVGIKQRTRVIAMKNIKKDEEICIDYAMVVDKYGKEIKKRDLICRCGSRNCRGEFGSWEKLSTELKKKYKGFVSDYLYEENDN